MRRVLGLGALVAAAMLSWGCLTADDILMGSTWTLAEVHGAPPVAEAAATFDGEGRFTVETGCNTVGGTYHLDGNRILLDTVNQTLMMCDGAVGDQEAAILAVIKNVPVYAIDTGTGRLRLTGDAGQVLLFEP